MVDDLSDKGECKAALIKYHQDPNTAASVVEATKAQGPNTAASEVEATKAQEVTVSSSHNLRARGALLKAAPVPNKTAGLNWKANSTTGPGLMAGSVGSLMGLISKAWPDQFAMLRWVIDQVVAACNDAAVLEVDDCDLGDLPQDMKL